MLPTGIIYCRPRQSANDRDLLSRSLSLSMISLDQLTRLLESQPRRSVSDQLSTLRLQLRST
ncbi:hypothetical protein RSSM_00840 [Rhodopirellula sallentina SM41]|uniref:Uncharacterized protein n=1 Tax=Rhodopirellula sallentina SM41 TaxID=1263870 RepID=M5UIS8_9BACT|nr:hypothetical protein RSSM_00840 [Rhodopirellula sallentina SM41]